MREDGGEERARWHLERGLETFRRVFGREPAGLWPSEGGVSQAALALFAESGFNWVASGGSVLSTNFPSQLDSITLMRSSSGGCVAKPNANNPPSAKNM